MTVVNTTAQVLYTGNGTQTVFTFSFLIPYQDDGITPAVNVYLIDNSVSPPTQTLIAPGLYLISGVGNDAGGFVQYPLTGSPINSSHQIQIIRALAFTQPQQFLNQGFLPKTVEEALDKVVLMIQQLGVSLGATVDVVQLVQDAETYAANASASATAAAASAASASTLVANMFITAHTWTARQTLAITNAGGVVYPIALQNGSGAASSATGISFDPGAGGIGTHDAQILAVNDGLNNVSIQFKVAAAAAPTTALTINYNNTITLNGYTTASGVLWADGTGAVTKVSITGSVVDTGSVQTLTNKTIDASLNPVSNIDLTMFAAGVIDTDGTLAANSDAKVASEKATKTYVDTATSALTRVAPVVVVATANITLSGEQTIDGVLTSASRVLVTAQTSAVNNGIYVSAAGAWSRASDASSGAQIVGSQTLILQGTVHSNKVWACTTPGPITIGVTSINYTEVTSGTAYSAGMGLTLTGNQFAFNFGGSYNWTSQQIFRRTAAGTGTVPLAVQNYNVYVAGQNVEIALQPSTTNDSRIEADAVNANSTGFSFYTQNAGVLQTSLILNFDRTARFPAYTTAGDMINDSSGILKTRPQTWVTVNLVGGGVCDTTVTDSHFIMINPTGGATGLQYLGDAPEGTWKVIRTNAAIDLFVNFSNFGDGITLQGLNGEIGYDTAYDGRYTMTTKDQLIFVATGATNTAGRRVWECVGARDNLVSYMLRPGGNGHDDGSPKLFTIGPPPACFNSSATQVPLYNFAIDQGQNSGFAKVYAGEVDLQCVGDGSRIRFTATAADGGGNPDVTAPIPGFVAYRPLVNDPVVGLAFPGAAGWPGPVIPSSPSSLYQGWCSREILDCLYSPTPGSSCGALVWQAATGTQGGATYGITPWTRMALHGESGNIVFYGKAAWEAGDGTWHGDPANAASWGSPAGFVNYRDTKGWAPVSIIATDSTSSACAYNAALAVRIWNNQTYGWDVGTDGTDIINYIVNAGTRIEYMRVRPSDSFPTLTYNSTQSKWNWTAAGAAPNILTIANAGTTAGSGAGIEIQAGASATNNVGILQMVGDGAGNVVFKVNLSANAAAANQLTLFQNGILQLPHYAAGSVTFDGSHNLVSSSDLRKKVVVAQFTGGLADIVSLPEETFIHFMWKSDVEKGVHVTFTGVGAQNLQKTMPYAVHEGSDGYLNRDHDAMLAAALRAIRELNSKIESLENEIAKFKER